MADLKDYKKVITEIQENIGVSEESLTSLAQDLSEEHSTSRNNDTRTPKKYEAYKPVIDNTNSSEEINCAFNMKRNIKNGISNIKQNRNLKIVNARTRSQKLSKTQSQGKNKLRTRRKDKNENSASSDTEAANEDRFTDLDEPEIDMQCKAKYIKLKPICKKDLEGIDLYVEVEIDKDLIVSPIQKYESLSCEKSKYTFKVSSLTEAKKHRRTKLETETLNDDHTTSARVKNRRKRELISAKSNIGKTDTETKTKKSKQIYKEEAFSVELDSQVLVSQHGYDSETDIEANGRETMQQTTVNETLYVTDSVIEKPKSDDIVLGDDKNCISATSKVQEDKEVMKPKVRRKKETKPRSPKKERNKAKKETANPVDYATRITEDGVKMYQCRLCLHETRFLNNLKTHYRKHTGERPYKCETCESYFTALSTLQEHQLSHTEARTFRCHLCPLGFKGRRDLRKHLERHSGDKRYLCYHCAARFYRGYELKSHLKTHSVEKKRFPCPSCQKQFSLKGNLDRHMLVHSGFKAFQCEKCGLGFARRDYLKKHEMSHDKT